MLSVVYSDTMNLGSLDYLNFLFIPLMVMTAIEVYKNRSSIWDNTLTSQDRYYLQRLVIFCLLPLVVFCHELGHVAAIKLFGGQVREFHFALVWGYVIPSGQFSAAQTVWIYFAGNLVQIIIGLLALSGAFIFSSPPVVALLVYLFFWAVGGTVIMYALMSLTGAYGDWVAIYTAPVPGLVSFIALVHGLLIALVLWGLYGQRPKLWFAAKTRPDWFNEQALLWQQAQLYPSAANWLKLAWSYFQCGLIKKSEEFLSKARSLNPHLPELLMLDGALALKKGNYDQSAAFFQRIGKDESLPPRFRARGYMALADCQLSKRNRPQAIAAFAQASICDPRLGDPRFYHATLLKEIGGYEEAERELMSCENLDWLDFSLAQRLGEELSQVQAHLSPPK